MGASASGEKRRSCGGGAEVCSSWRRFWRTAMLSTVVGFAGPSPSPHNLGRIPSPSVHPGAFLQFHWMMRPVACFTV